MTGAETSIRRLFVVALLSDPSTVADRKGLGVVGHLRELAREGIFDFIIAYAQRGGRMHFWRESERGLREREAVASFLYIHIRTAVVHKHNIYAVWNMWTMLCFWANERLEMAGDRGLG